MRVCRGSSPSSPENLKSPTRGIICGEADLFNLHLLSLLSSYVPHGKTKQNVVAKSVTVALAPPSALLGFNLTHSINLTKGFVCVN